MSLIASLVLLTLGLMPFPASAWNIPGHMLSAAIAYQVLQQENPPTIEKVKEVLERHPWYAHQWQARLQDVSVAERDMVLFMQVARWTDDIRTREKPQNRPPWHYINLPFKPEVNATVFRQIPTDDHLSLVASIAALAPKPTVTGNET